MVTLRTTRWIAIASATLLLISLLTLATPTRAAPTPAASSANEMSSELTKSNAVTYQGVTITWTASDFSDATFTETPTVPDTPGTSENVTTGQASIIAYKQAKFRLSIIQDGGIAMASVNGCTFSPDRWGRANFNGVCNAHDICYGNRQGISRYTCDVRFLVGLQSVCTSAYPNRNQAATRTACYGVAQGYYQAVRNFGYFNYKGNGSRW
ncbi:MULTISPECIES: phospholipase A2 [Kocuria]|uniref:Phospholipase A2 n=1 Tax=Kocuria subflava TaxID=1736139 RepID=A0A846U751_9MICC|nr:MULTISPECIES: phospholipase A2 [Kocuria]NKE10611.1 hypothetical protein [Kocuria subflava]